MRTLASSTAALLAFGWALALSGCGAPKTWEPGVDLTGSREALAAQLQGLLALRGALVAEWATPLAERIDELSCPRIEGHCGSLESCPWVESLRCSDGVEAGDAWTLRAATPDWQLFVAAGSPSALPQAIHIQLELATGYDAGWTRLLPGPRPPGPARLSSREALIHARIRPDRGLDVVSSVAEGGSADRLFRLRNELFAATALEGVVELAIYLPTQGEKLPPAAVALELRSREVGIRALESLIGDLKETWPITREPWSHRGFSGACLRDLTVLPDLAPCYLVVDRTLVLGWNQESLRKALAEGPPGPDDGLFRADLTLFPEADQALADPSERPSPPLEYPWSAIALDGRRTEDRYELDLTLEGSPPLSAESSGR